MLPARHLVAVAGLALAGTAALPSAAQAQTPPPAARPLDPADMQVASQIIAVILPPEQRWPSSSA
jgi:nucleoid-associated protein YgaU